MKMSDNPTKYEVLIDQYLRSILDLSAVITCTSCAIFLSYHIWTSHVIYY